MDEAITSSFGSMLKRFRQRQKLSQQKLAERMERSRESISLWERGLEYPDTRGMILDLIEELRLDEEEKRLFFEARYGTPAILPFHNLPECDRQDQNVIIAAVKRWLSTHKECEYAYEVYDQKNHPALGQSPREAFDQGMKLAGMRTHMLIPYSEEFLILTCPTTRTGFAKLDDSRGIVVNGLRYGHPLMRSSRDRGRQVPVR